MTTRIATPTAPSGQEASPVIQGREAAYVIDELDEIVKKSHRPSALQLVLHAAGAGFVRWLDRLVPEKAPSADPGLPPEIRFPCF